MTQPPQLVYRGTGGIAALVNRGPPTLKDCRAFRLAAAILFACMHPLACPPATGQQLLAAADERPHLVAAPGRGVTNPACPSLADGRGGRVRSQRTGGAAEASFARDCPAATAQPGPLAEGKPAKPPKPAEPSLAVPGLAAGSVQADLASYQDHADGVPLVVRLTPERLSATVLTGGTALWFLQSGFWTYLLILGLPLWRHVDLLPIVDSESNDDGPPTNAAAADADEERAVAHVLQAQDPSRADDGARR